MSLPSGIEILSKKEVLNSIESLPLTRLVAQENKNSLKDGVIIHINHALSDVFALNEILVNKLGAELFFISTPYNNVYYQNPNCNYLFTLRKGNDFKYFLNGKKIHIKEKPVDIVESIHLCIKYALKFIQKNFPNKKIILLQDGGYSAADTKFFDSIPFAKEKNFLGTVEQTQGGTRLFHKKLQNEEIPYPVITISRSFIKMRVESHFIAKRILEEVNYALYRMGYFLNFKTIAIGGYGVIGRQLSEYVSKENCKVIVIENHQKIGTLAEKENYLVSSELYKEIFDKTFCYIGCTGKCTFGLQALMQFMESKNKYYILASGSSKQNEFEDLIKFFEDKKFRSKAIKKHPHLKNVKNPSTKDIGSGVINYRFNYHGVIKDILILAEGYPINLYYHEVQSVPDRAIDPIQALLLLSVIKLKHNYHKLKNGLHHVSNKDTIKLLNFNEEILLKKWCYLNDITLENKSPYQTFTSHPLEDLLIGLY